MKLKDRYLVVAAIISGKNFPSRNGFNLVAEAKFDGEVLSTDPVAHSESPLFEQELAWELDKKTLHQHKLQRTCLKIQFFAISNLSPVKEFVGYIMLDLRSASANKAHKFYALLHGKYSKTRPEVCCAIYMDDDGQEVVLEDANIDKAMIDPTQLKPKLISKSAHEPCYYQIGPDKLCKDGFLMALTIFEASNLTHLIPTDIPISNTGDSGFYFYYDLFGNSIISEKFTDLVSAKFSTERASVNILSTLDILKMYFKHQECIEIHLCCNQHSLGIAKIPISTLLNNADHSFQQPAVLENSFNFYNPRTIAKQTRQLDWNMHEPSIRISLVLQRVERFGDEPIKEMKRYRSTENCAQNIGLRKSQSKENLNFAKGLEMHINENTEYFSETIPKEAMHHLCYSIELRSIRNLARADHTKRIYARYVYPLFGSAAPIITHPPIEVRRDQDVLLPQGYCAFEFGGSWKSLERKLFNNPLIVEIFERDKTKDSDHCLGIVKIALNKVLSNYSKKLNHKGHACLTFSDVGQILDTNNASSNARNIGQLVYNLTLEDFGPLKEHLGVRKAEKRTRWSSNSNLQMNEDEDGRNNAEYKAALELELWREAEEISFLTRLKERENQTMISLAEEWKKRDKERELLIKKKVAEYEELEKALRTAIMNLAQRERQLAAGEIELQRLRKDLESEAERRTTDLREASRRLEQDCQHQNLMLSSHVEHWKSMAQDWQQKYQYLDKEFTQYKARQSNTPETKLHSEVNQLKSDKLKLEEALESSLKSKAHYKKQWVRALNEVARLKQKHDQLSKDQLRRQEIELEQMKMRYKTVEDSTAGGSSQLDVIRQELHKLREEAQLDSQKLNDDSDRLDIDINGMDEATTEHVMRLIEERDVLLRTGLYTSHDPVITELDREVKKLMGMSSKN